MQPPFEPARALYVHVPFCSSKCSYCDFYSKPAVPPSLMEGVIEATLRRIDALSALYGPGGTAARATVSGNGSSAGAGPSACSPDGGRRFDTIYIGGGTPSVLPHPLLGRLLDGIASRAGWRGAPGTEWTVEANPESLDAGALDLMAASGVTRLSIGVQSLDDALLLRLGRRARARDARRALELAARSGIPRRSADLIAGLPRRAGSLAAEAAALLDLGVEHLSVYDLVLEEGTPLAAEVAAGHFVLPGEDEAADERDGLEAMLRGRGFRRYEVSNYALPGAESRHNLVYWRLDSYIGAGPGAVSTLVSAVPGGGSLRIEEGRSLEACAAGAAERTAVQNCISAKDAAFESIMMGFRTVFGLERARFRKRHGVGLEVLIGETLDAWKTHIVPGLLPDSLALDGAGLNLENRFLEDCLGEIDRKFPDALS